MIKDSQVGIIKISRWERATIYIDILDIFKYNQKKWYWRSVINMLRKNYSLEWEHTVMSIWFYEKLGAKISKNRFYFTKLK